MLGLVGNAGPAASVVEEAVYDPGLQQSGDLESGTRAVTATTMGGAADYTTALTVPAPADARLVVCRLATSLVDLKKTALKFVALVQLPKV